MNKKWIKNKIPTLATWWVIVCGAGGRHAASRLRSRHHTNRARGPVARAYAERRAAHSSRLAHLHTQLPHYCGGGGYMKARDQRPFSLPLPLTRAPNRRGALRVTILVTFLSPLRRPQIPPRSRQQGTLAPTPSSFPGGLLCAAGSIDLPPVSDCARFGGIGEELGWGWVGGRFGRSMPCMAVAAVPVFC